VATGRSRDALIEELWFAFRTSERALHERTRAGVASGGLTFPRVTLLRLLVHRGRATSRDLAEALGVTSANLPGLLDKLEADGYVTRTRDRSDRRVVYVEVTAKGRKKLRALWRAALRALASGFAAWSDQDLRGLRDLLARIGREGCGTGCAPGLTVLPSTKGGPVGAPPPRKNRKR
jgi:MarR family transcriptional regulator, 2-MHQ and catechol-resistance regulon repressor